MTTMDIPATYFVPGLRFWGQAGNGRVGIVAQNANGAVELWIPAGQEIGPLIGEVVVHSPSPVAGGWVLTMECSVLGGTCHTHASPLNYQRMFRPLLAADDIRGVLGALADWHDTYFSPVSRP